MAMAQVAPVPWWREPTKDQWYAYVAAWLGWTLDAFDFTDVPADHGADRAGVPRPAGRGGVRFHGDVVAAAGRRVGSGWLADRVGRKTPLMISILWYSICNFIAGFSPTFWFLFLFRALLGIGMGAEWPAGAALAMETWPMRSRGFMSGVLQGSWGIGFLLSSAALWSVLRLYRLARAVVDRRAAGAWSVLYIRKYVKEPEVWMENREKQRDAAARSPCAADQDFPAEDAGQHADGLLVDGEQIRRLLLDLGLFATHLQKDLHLGPATGAADRPGQSDRISRQLSLGLDRRPHRPALGDDDPGGDRRF